MSNEALQQEKSRAYFKSWYDKHGEERIAKRREDYASDPKVREAARERARRRRAGLIDSKPRNPTYRLIGGKQIRAYLISEVSDAIDRDAQTIRAWEKKGWIPKDTFGEGKRLYTHNQVQLMRVLAEYLMGASTHASWSHNQMVGYIADNWEK